MDANTISSAQRGDAGAMRAVATAARPLAMAAALAVLSRVDDAEDAAQEALVAVVHQLGDLRDPGAFTAWVRGIARHKALSRARDRQRSAPLPDEVADASDDVEALIARGDLKAGVQRAIDALPESSREAVMLFYWEGLSTAAVARALGLSEDALRQRLSRARQALRVDLVASMAVMWPGLLPPETPLPTWAPTSSSPTSPNASSPAGLGGWFAGGTLTIALIALGALVWALRNGGPSSDRPIHSADVVLPVGPSGTPSVPPPGEGTVPDAIDAGAVPSGEAAQSRGTIGTGRAQNPVWSVDGRAIAFEVHDDAGPIDLYVARVDRGTLSEPWRASVPGVSRLPGFPPSPASNPRWHPAGLVLFEAAPAGALKRLYLYQPGGGLATELLAPGRSPGDLNSPVVSPDGGRVFYVATRDAEVDLYRWDRASDVVTRLTHTTGAESAPAPSPDGRTLAYVRGGQIFELDLASGVERAVHIGASTTDRPAYAASGRIVSFAARGEAWDLLAIDADGAATTVATGVDLPLRAPPALTPDGAWVAWTPEGVGGSSVIRISAVDGSRTIAIDTGHERCGEPALTVADGRIWLAFTFLPRGSDGRSLAVLDVTERLR